MDKKGLRIWSNVSYHGPAIELLKAGVGDHELALDSGIDQLATRESLAAAEIAFGQPDVETLRQSKSLLWIHLDSAGYEKYDTDQLRRALKQRGAVLTNSSGVYNEPCAQQTLAMMMSLARRLPYAHEVQWKDRSWPMMELRAESYLLNHQTALLLGFGAIARRLVELLAPLQMNLVAVRRQPSGVEPIPIITEDQLDRYLPVADHVINLLPANAGTRHYVDAGFIARLKPGAVFYNIGRGSTVDQEALLKALDSGRLGAAFLDVTDPEPLPPADPLWSAPNCFITPHTAGGHIGEKDRLVRHFLSNLRRYTEGQPLNDRIF